MDEIIVYSSASLVEDRSSSFVNAFGMGTLTVGCIQRGFGIIRGGGAAVDNLLNTDELHEKEG